ncbi:MAG TPA: glycosyltransferase family 4 protein, partial [Bryobacteraceae bacterium]|nr:glycosyltransferase family 4 protein [Bryobacteraceae bacterium]
MRLLRALRKESSIRIDFQPISPRFPAPLAFLRSIKFVRTLAGILLYAGQLLARVGKYDVVHVFSAGYTSYLFWTVPALLVSKLFRKKIILNYRDGQAEDHLQNWRIALPTVRMMDEVVAPSGFLVDVFAKFGLRISTISNILDMEPFIYRKRSRLRPVFLHNRILEPLYNIPCSLRAFQIVQQKYPEASLTIAHDGPSRTELEQLVRDLGLRNTIFVGRVPHAEIPTLYDQADVYFTSPDFDCMPGSILESFSSGLPVVATNTGGIPYIAGNGQTALLVPRGDHQAMAAAAFRLLEDPSLVERLTRQAYESCGRYAEGPVREQWTALYHALMAGKHA